jgi:hypothetical protein
MINAGRGELLDFLGNPVRGHGKEMPTGMPDVPLSESGPDIEMPIEGYAASMRLRFFIPVNNGGTGIKGIVCLYDRWGHIVKQWPDGEIPGTDEVRRFCYE